MRKKIVITGRRLHDIGYRYFLTEAALNYGIERFRAVNVLNRKQEVNVFVEGKEKQLEDYFEYVKSSFHPDAEVEEVSWQDYAGHVPKIESFALVFNTGQAGKFIEIGRSVSGKMDSMLEKQDSMLEKQDAMLEKQDKTIKILESVEEDTSAIKEDTSAIKKNTESMPEMFSRVFDELDKIRRALIKAGIEI